jgi:hypothetical protein
LKFHLFEPAFAFMLNEKGSSGRNINPLPRDLDIEGFALFQAIGQPAQLGDHLFDRIVLFDVPILFSFHNASRIPDKVNPRVAALGRIAAFLHAGIDESTPPRTIAYLFDVKLDHLFEEACGCPGPTPSTAGVGKKGGFAIDKAWRASLISPSPSKNPQMIL